MPGSWPWLSSSFRRASTCFASRSESCSANSVIDSQTFIHESASFVFGPQHPSSLLHSSPVMPVMSVWMVEGPIDASAKVKVHSSALLIVRYTSKSATIVPWITYHSSSASLSQLSCTTAQPHAASLPDTPFNEPSTAMSSRRPSILLSQSREVSDIHVCFQGVLPVISFACFEHDVNLPCRFQSSFDDFAFMSHDITTSGSIFVSSIPCTGTFSEAILRGFWARGRVRGDRSVFVTSHRPVHSSRALMFQPGSSFCISVQERYFFLFAHLPPRCTSMSLDLELAKILDAHNQGIATGVQTAVFV